MADLTYYNTLDADYKIAFLQLRDNAWQHANNTCRSLQVSFYLAMRRDVSTPFPTSTGKFCSKPKMTDEIKRMLSVAPIKMDEVDPIHAHEKSAIIQNAPRPKTIKVIKVIQQVASPMVDVDRKVFQDLYKIIKVQLDAMNAEGKIDPKAKGLIQRAPFEAMLSECAKALAYN
jgi:hypothetical protein